MPTRKSFLLRVDPKLLEEMERWAADELRSTNAQIEFVLRKTLRDVGRGPSVKPSSTQDSGTCDDQ